MAGVVQTGLSALREALANPAWLKQKIATEISSGGPNADGALQLLKRIRELEKGQVKMPDMNQLRLKSAVDGIPLERGAYGVGAGVSPEQAIALQKALSRPPATISPLSGEQLPLSLKGVAALPTGALGLTPDDKSVMDEPQKDSGAKSWIDSILESLKDPGAMAALGIGASGNAYQAGGVVRMDKGGLFSELGILDKLKILGKGAYLKGKHFSESEKHATYPDQARDDLSRSNPELGTNRIDRGSLDRAINFAGGYDWGSRPSVPYQDAKDMAKAYQLFDYMTTFNPKREMDAQLDYDENLQGIDAAHLDKYTTGKSPRSEIIRRSADFGKTFACGGRVQWPKSKAHGGLAALRT